MAFDVNISAKTKAEIFSPAIHWFVHIFRTRSFGRNLRGLSFVYLKPARENHLRIAPTAKVHSIWCFDDFIVRHTFFQTRLYPPIQKCLLRPSPGQIG